MVSVVLFGIYLALLVIQLYRYCFYRPPNFPPGPPRLPLVGSYLFLLLIDEKNIHKAIIWLCKRYKTRHLGLFIGNTPAIVTTDQEGVREVLFNSAFDGRPEVYVANMRDPKMVPRGIFFLDGGTWKEQRRFTLRHLRDYGFGRRFDTLERDINEEITSFMETVRDGPKYPHEFQFFRKGSRVLLPLALFPTLGNCFLQVLFGERLSREEQGIIYNASVHGLAFQRTGDDYGKLLSVIPWIRFFFPEKSGYKTFKLTNKKLHDFMRGLVDKYISTYKEGLERNFIDLYIQEMNKTETAEERSFIYDQLILTCLDFFFPALTAVGAQITFIIEYLMKMPEFREKMQREIDDVVGRGRLPTLDDRMHMPYTEAVIRETMRFDTLTPSAIPHRALYPTKFLDYDVPQGTVLLVNLYAMHTDEKLWGDPEVFRPERFLDMRGQLSLKKDISLPFGAGKRLCAGETFARNALFLMTAAIFQNFNFELPPGQTVDNLIERNETGLIRTTPNFWITLADR